MDRPARVEDCLYEGWLLKRGPNARFNFKKYWCALSQKRFDLYEDQTKSMLKYPIDLQASTRITLFASKEKSLPGEAAKYTNERPFGFVLDVDPRAGKDRHMFYFDAQQIDHLMAWETAFVQCQVAGEAGDCSNPVEKLKRRIQVATVDEIVAKWKIVAWKARTDRGEKSAIWRLSDSHVATYIFLMADRLTQSIGRANMVEIFSEWKMLRPQAARDRDLMNILRECREIKDAAISAAVLDVKYLRELASLKSGSRPAAVCVIMEALVILLTGINSQIRVDNRGRPEGQSEWRTQAKLLQDEKATLKALNEIANQAESIPKWKIDGITKLGIRDLSVDQMMKTSIAAAQILIYLQNLMVLCSIQLKAVRVYVEIVIRKCVITISTRQAAR